MQREDSATVMLSASSAPAGRIGDQTNPVGRPREPRGGAAVARRRSRRGGQASLRGETKVASSNLAPGTNDLRSAAETRRLTPSNRESRHDATPALWWAEVVRLVPQWRGTEGFHPDGSCGIHPPDVHARAGVWLSKATGGMPGYSGDRNLAAGRRGERPRRPRA